MKTPKQIFDTLALLAPGIAVAVHWTRDDDARWSDISEALPGESRDDWQAWETEVRATAIVKGKEIVGNAYLCGTWEKYGDNPAQSNPDISGYLPQKIAEALEELNSAGCGSLLSEIAPARNFMRQEMQERYDEQMQST